MTLVFLAVEVAGGLLSGSLALLSDAGHMASDAAALLLSLFALRIARRPPTPRMTFGYRRTEILAALANAAGLLVVSGLILVEAYHRWLAPPPVRGGLMLSVALAGFLANLAGAWILGRGVGRNLNLRSARLHVLSDLMGSLGAIVASLVLLATGWRPVDPLLSALIALLIVRSAWRLLRESVDVLMEGTPSQLAYRQVEAALEEAPGVAAVHDLHIWSIAPSFPALSCHVRLREEADPGEIHLRLQRMLRERFGIEHATLQLELPDEAHDYSCQ